MIEPCLSTQPRSASLYLALAALVLAAPLTARATTSWVLPSSAKVRPSDPPGTEGTAVLTAAQNEFESFQIAVAGPLSGVSAVATALSGPGQIPAPHLYREELIQLGNASGPDGATGAFPDALIPDVDEFVGEKRNAFPFDVPGGENRVLLVEFHVPPDAPPGEYQGSVTVRASGQPDVVVPVSLTVWDFALPSTSSLKSWFGLYFVDLQRAHGLPTPSDAFSALRARYAQLGLDHRVSFSGIDDGNADLSHFAQVYGPFLDGTAPTQLKGARFTSVQFMGQRTTATYATWASFFRSHGWFDRLFDYTCDEPPQTCAWSDIPARNSILKAADPEFRSLVTTDIASAAANGVASSIDVLTPVVNWMYDKPGRPDAGPQRSTYDGFLSSGPRKELWMYQSCMSHGCSGGATPYDGGWASYAIDASSVRARAMEWLSFLYRVSGELYWDASWAFENGDAWTNQWAFGGNGDGTLLYPGTPGRIGGQTDIPIASLRMKMIREGMEDFEYLKLLSDAGDPGLANQLAGALFGNPWTQPSVADLLAARDRIARRILELNAKPAPNAIVATGTTASSEATVATLASAGGGTGCSAGSSGELAALLGVSAALLIRRRRRS